MVIFGQRTCPDCGGSLKHYDRVRRITKTKNGQKEWIYICRLKCVNCKKLHRELPEELLPFKHYESEVIFGVQEKLITPDTLGFQDFPCERTMQRWLGH